MRATLLIPLALVGVAALDSRPQNLVSRHGDDEHDDDDAMDMTHGHDEEPIATSASMIAESSAVASPLSAVSSPAATPSAHDDPPAPHDPHGHHSHAPVKVALDDADIHRWHKFPPTYLDADFRLTQDQVIFGETLEDWDLETVPSHRGLMLAHVACMMLAYFAALPITLALRAAGHPSHYLANTVFLGITIAGWLMGVAYKAAMPDMYEGAKHGSIGTLLVFLSIGLGVLDSLGLISSAIAHYRAGHRDWKSFFSEALHATREDKFVDQANRYEMVGLDDEGHNIAVFALGEYDEDDSAPSSGRVSPHSPSRSSRHSTGSEGTLRDTPTSSRGSAHMFEMGMDRPKIKISSNTRGAFDAHGEHAVTEPHWINVPIAEPEKIGAKASATRSIETLLTVIRRTQVVIAYVAVCTGIPVYVGMCRAGFINTCAAHIVKGSIFFLYGVLTFGRYLGAYADLGWAWNRRPAGSKAVSAEMVECFVIFLYGVTNTWMERFGAKHGDPYTVKQVQHISIAVMFWFAGLSGMLLESPRIRRVLGAVVFTDRSNNGKVREPPSYAFSFNPLPALVIAITGLAMAAHHQDYKFQVEIHSLWGLLLAGGSVFRFLTYFFLWLRPPTDSALPSRPPTEILTSFGWAAGGIVFMLSDEEIAFAAMRSGFDDMMAFLNITIALTCLVFCWIVVVLAIKGYALLRLKRGVELADGDEEEARV